MPILSELFFPLSLRYHALHHLFPTLPYHNLHAAHTRLMAQLPPDSAYHRILRPGFWSVAIELVQSCYRRRPNDRKRRTWFLRREKLIASPTTPVVCDVAEPAWDHAAAAISK
jgi:hypothetical protein